MPRLLTSFAWSSGKEAYWAGTTDMQQMTTIVMAKAKRQTRTTRPPFDDQAAFPPTAASGPLASSLLHLLQRAGLEQPGADCVMILILDMNIQEVANYDTGD